MSEIITDADSKVIYSKIWGHMDYVILNQKEYDHYWVGKRPSTRECFEDWLKDPNASMFEASKKHGKYSWSIQVHVTAMKKLGILIRRKRVGG